MAKAVDFFDTNILVAATIPSHVHHVASHARLALLRKSGATCAAHTLTEAYSVLTRLPFRYRLSAGDAIRVVEDTRSFSALVSLTPTETLHTLHDLAERNIIGGTAYDGILMACARKIEARRIYTFNTKHFRLIAPDLASRIMEP